MADVIQVFGWDIGGCRIIFNQGLKLAIAEYTAGLEQAIRLYSIAKIAPL
jgi:hypothetical protein